MIKNIWVLTNLPKSKLILPSSIIHKGFQNYDFYFFSGQQKDEDWYLNGALLYQNKGFGYAEEFWLSDENMQLQLAKNFSGNFILINLKPNNFTLFSDPFAVNKFFYWRNKESFIFSNDLKIITQIIKPTPSLQSMARYAIHYHFTAGTTAFENVFHNEPAQIIKFDNGLFHFDTYRNPQDLLTRKVEDVGIEQISSSLSLAVDNGLNLTGKERISLSLTGGADTRNLLAVFLNKGIKPHLYTYGNPKSADGIKASAIAQGLGLEHTIHDIQMTTDLFEEYARKIIRLGCGMASIHRAHRVIAIEREKEFADFMFLGTLGGEFIRGVSEDDYITPASVFNHWNSSELTKETLVTYLKSKYIKPESIKLDQFLDSINNEPFMTGAVNIRKHNALSYITAHLHDAQDINLYGEIMERVYTPFLDTSYLELVFSSPFSFNHKEEIKNKYLKRIENPVYASRFLKATYPPLLDFLYSGDHKPSEVIFNKYYAAIAKAVRQKSRKAYPPNFPLGQWMVDFVGMHLPGCFEHEALNRVFDLQGLMHEFSLVGHKANEAYWLKFTNPIMMKFIIEELS